MKVLEIEDIKSIVETIGYKKFYSMLIKTGVVTQIHTQN